ncbi:enoyl-CoA hydratase-related protein [Shouchella shacheensis]|uniref:enoyl-CoA hydratase-related protein n=1 Tax=Shouchella shacheensis TaxID=1649580 RepID=UPI00073FCB87|nr:enoyl-CoA hydratase-related protein [Shouchella shacheensis]
MSEEPILVEERNGCTFIRLNRPSAANALSKEALLGLRKSCERIREDVTTRVVVLTSAGNKTFSAGADLKERREMSQEEAREAVTLIGEVMEEVASLPQPVIAAVNGSAFGGGLELALAADIRVFAKEGKYGLTETSLAIIPGAGGTQRLPRLIGIGKAKELIYSARRISGEEAFECGLCEQLVPLEGVEEAARVLATRIAKNGPVALRAAKSAMDEGFNETLTEGLAIESRAYARTLATKDRLEGLQAFKEKRQPKYSGE